MMDLTIGDDWQPTGMTQPAYTHNGQPVSAEAFYAIACDPRRSVAVEACAGAGKTWMLVSRMLRALLEGSDSHDDRASVKAHEILAITFTKKAAGEMRERLYEWLEQFAHADDETLRRELVIRGVIGQTDPHSPPRLREQLSNLYRKVLENGRPVQIRTFHSWFAALLRSAPMAALSQLGLPVNYDLLEDDGPAKALVWRRFYAALTADAHLGADYACVVQTHGRFQAEKALQVALDKRTEFLLADAVGVVDASVQHFAVQFPAFTGLEHPDEVLQTSAAHRQLFSDAARALGQASAPTFSAKGVELEAALAGNDMPGVLAALLTDKCTPRKFSEKIAGIATVRQAQDLALEIDAARSQHEAWQWQHRLARLSRLLLAEYTALKRERGWVDMNDVERAALVMLSDPVLAGWIQERLDARVRHLMIDEFQDTNPLQWQALSSWLGSYGGAGNAPSVFIVGDPKQSIYRFRRAEPQVFVAAQSFLREVLNGELLACDHTRRNSKTVISTVNAVMSDARQNSGYIGFREHTSASIENGQIVRLPTIPREPRSKPGEDGQTVEALWRDSLTTPRELPEETLRTLEARQAAHWIAGQVRAGVKPSGIMVLSRKRAGLAPLQIELRALQIPAQIGEKTSLGDCCEVQDIVALLDVLVSSQHDLSLARALRSPLFGISSDALVQLALLKGQSDVSWFELLQNSELLPQEMNGLGAVLIKYRGWIDQLPPHDALQAIYHHGDVLARFAAAAPPASRSTVLANLNALPGAALQLDGGRFATPYALVRALKAGGLQAPAAVDAQAVRLLTVHGAKGLEAHSVVLLDTDTLERSADSMSVLIDWPGDSGAPQKFVFLISESRPPACAEKAFAIEQEARAREELNALYVALTRARHTLVISSIAPHRETTSSWWQRLCPFMGDAVEVDIFADAPHGAFPAGGDGSPVPLAQSFDLPDLPDLPASPQAQIESAAAVLRQKPANVDSVASLVGKAMHRLLEWGAGSHDWTEEQNQRVTAAVLREYPLSASQLSAAQSAAERIRHGAAAWAWDASCITWEANEVEIIFDGQMRRIDRLVRRKDAGHVGEWWVLDYKSSARPQDDAELMAQIGGYVEAVQGAYPGELVRAAFLTGEGALIEVGGSA